MQKQYACISVGMRLGLCTLYSRNSRDSAARSVAHSSREAITTKRIGAMFYVHHRDMPGHSAFLLLEGAVERFRGSNVP